MQQFLLDRLPGSVLVGGTVRNAVLGVTAKSDIDLLVAGCKLMPAEYLQMHMPDAEVLKTVGSTVRAKAHVSHIRPIVFDLTVVAHSLQDNMRSRDLTINGLLQTADGSVVDHVSGLADCFRRKIDTYGDPLSNWANDPCRIVRAIRFKSQLTSQTHQQWSFSPKVRTALYEQTDLVCQLLSQCNPSRLRNEVVWLFKAGPACETFQDVASLPGPIVSTMLRLAGGHLALQGD